MKKFKLSLLIVLVAIMLTAVVTLAVTASDALNGTVAFAEESGESETVSEAEEDDGISAKAIAAAIVVGIVAAAGAIGMAIAISKSTDNMARQPEIASKINSSMMLGLVFIETAIIYALIVAILIIFVL